jgi:hypothetical protein
MDSEADYQAVKAQAIRNGGVLTQREVFAVTVGGYCKCGRIVDRLVAEGVIEREHYYIDEADKPSYI